MSAKKILVMGLPGAGKTTLAEAMVEYFQGFGHSVDWFNADKVREQFNDWDFTPEGRARQSKRMADLANNSDKEFVICDFVAPVQATRDNFAADYTVWVDTIESGRFEDTNKMFSPPEKYEYRVKEQMAVYWASIICHDIILKEKRNV
jgi:adenylylsulfate kinase